MYYIRKGRRLNINICLESCELLLIHETMLEKIWQLVKYKVKTLKTTES